MKLLQDIENYIPYNEQEACDRQELLKWLRSGEDVFTRDNTSVHFTASSWVVSPDRQQVLMAFHNLHQTWAWMGGHADGDTDLFHVACKELTEESSLSEFKPVSDSIFSLEVITMNGHIRRGTYVSSHIHLNVTYLFEADPSLPIRIQPDENSAIGWVPVAEVESRSNEPWFYEHVYRKLIEKATKER